MQANQRREMAGTRWCKQCHTRTRWRKQCHTRTRWCKQCLSNSSAFNTPSWH